MREQQGLPCVEPICFSNIGSLVCFNKCSVWMKYFTSSLGNNQIGGGRFLNRDIIWCEWTSLFYKWQNQDEDGIMDKTLASQYPCSQAFLVFQAETGSHSIPTSINRQARQINNWYTVCISYISGIKESAHILVLLIFFITMKKAGHSKFDCICLIC